MTAGAPLALYARWQLRDAVGRALIAPLVFVGIAGIPLWSVHRQLATTVGGEADFQQIARVVYGQTLDLALVLGAVMLVNGVVSTDREKQHFRFLFSRSVPPWRFYLQQFVVSVALFVALFALIPVGFGLLVTAVPIAAALKAAALYALLIGALSLLCGALVNKDGVLLVLVAMLGFTLQRADLTGELPGWASWLADLLPPFLAADAVSTAWLAGRSASAGDVTLVLLYALGMLVAALAIIRRAPLAR